MEQTEPAPPRRSALFNPEAATFSPTAAKVGAAIGTAGPALTTSPQHRSSVQDVYDQESPFRTARDMRPIYHSPMKLRSTHLPNNLPDQKHMPLEELQEMLREHRIALNHDRPSSAHNTVFQLNPINSSTPYPPPGLFSTQRREPNFSAPEVDELSANLGLPGMQRREKIEGSPERSQASHDLENYSEDSLYAHYLNGKSASTGDSIMAPQGLHGYSYGTQAGRECDENQPTRLVQPPPGFAGERPRKIQIEERSAVSPAAMEPQMERGDHDAFAHPRRFSDLQSVNLPRQQQHTGGHVRRPSDRRQYRSRASTRTKRTDQGPEPSAADIYPDDAFHMPPPPPPPAHRRPLYAPEPATRFQQSHTLATSAPQTLYVEEAISWPTPAEVYTQQQQQQQQPRKPEQNSPPRLSTFARNATASDEPYTHPHPHPPPPVASLPTILSFLNQLSPPVSPLFSLPPPFPTATTATTIPSLDIFANHTYPSATDMSAADAEVDMLLSLLPRIFELELPHLSCDGRLLTPGQCDGRRYGLRFYGLGLGDEWMDWEGV